MLPKAGESWTIEEAAHLLNRAGFGGSPGEIRTWHKLDRKRAVEKLVSPPAATNETPIPEWAEPERARADMLARREQLRGMRMDMRGAGDEQAEKLRREARQQVQRENRRHMEEARDWWFRRMLDGRAPLHEKMTLFWHDHFATSAQKVREPILMLRQNQLFRQHACGNFKQLAAAIVEDPAMMLYLDTQNSRKGKPNENFAREVMELFTLGEGNYTEQDVAEAARAFTGYRLDRFTGEVSHSPRMWDEGNKTILGEKGRFKGGDVIELIFRQPAAATFIARKIWEFFVYENPPESGVDALAKVLRDADYDMSALLREIFLSREFYSAAAIRTQIKCPVQYLAALIKQLEIAEPPTLFVRGGQLQLGQILFMPPNVAGWDWGKAWINTNTLLNRYNLAGFITKGADTRTHDSDDMERSMAREMMQGMGPAGRRMGRAWKGPDYEKIAPRPLRENPAQLVDSLVFRFFQGPVPDKARASFIEYARAKQGVIFTNNEVAELCHLMLSTPYYQLC